jgi:hypothetical protein
MQALALNLSWADTLRRRIARGSSSDGTGSRMTAA